MRKTEYISTEFNRYGVSNEKVEVKWVWFSNTGNSYILCVFVLCLSLVLFLFRIGVSVKQQFTEEEIYKDRDSQISAIEKTFEDAQKTVSQLIFRMHMMKFNICCIFKWSDNYIETVWSCS